MMLLVIAWEKAQVCQPVFNGEEMPSALGPSVSVLGLSPTHVSFFTKEARRLAPELINPECSTCPSIKSGAQRRNPPLLPRFKSCKRSTTVLSDIRESAQGNVQKQRRFVSAGRRALFISNISSFCRVLSPN